MNSSKRIQKASTLEERLAPARQYDLECTLFDQITATEPSTRDADDLFQVLAHGLAKSLGAGAVSVLVPRGSGEFIERAAFPGQLSRTVRMVVEMRPPKADFSLRVKPWSPGWSRKYQTCCTVAVRRDGQTSGILQLGFGRPREVTFSERNSVQRAFTHCLNAAERIALINELAAREQQMRALAAHMLHVEEAERRRISRELHDDAGQSLVCIRLQMELLEGYLPAESGELKARLVETRDLVEKTILDVRRLIADLSPAVLESLGLWPAIRQLVNRFRRSYNCTVRLRGSSLDHVPPRQRIVTYRILQECCSNIAKHSAASHVNISVTSTDGVLRLHVQDDGVGFNLQESLSKPQTFGLAGMRERVTLLGGKFHVESRPAPYRGKHRGTEIQVEMPIRAEEQDKTFGSGM